MDARKPKPLFLYLLCSIFGSLAQEVRDLLGPLDPPEVSRASAFVSIPEQDWRRLGRRLGTLMTITEKRAARLGLILLDDHTAVFRTAMGSLSKEAEPSDLANWPVPGDPTGSEVLAAHSLRPTKADLDDAPCLTSWHIRKIPPSGLIVLEGIGIGHPRLPSGPIRTSAVVGISLGHGLNWARTMSRVYVLGLHANPWFLAR